MLANTVTRIELAGWSDSGRMERNQKGHGAESPQAAEMHYANALSPAVEYESTKVKRTVVSLRWHPKYPILACHPMVCQFSGKSNVMHLSRSSLTVNNTIAQEFARQCGLKTQCETRGCTFMQGMTRRFCDIRLFPRRLEQRLFHAIWGLEDRKPSRPGV